MGCGALPAHVSTTPMRCIVLARSLEDWNGTDRHHFNAVVTPQDEADTYLVAFQAAVEEAQVSSLMCSYNEVR